MITFTEDQEKTADQIIEKLPSGSGFDAKWELNQIYKNGKYEFISYYHNMNEHGYYDGWTSLRLVLHPEKLSDFRLYLSGKKRYTNYSSREHYESTILYSLES